MIQQACRHHTDRAGTVVPFVLKLMPGKSWILLAELKNNKKKQADISAQEFQFLLIKIWWAQKEGEAEGVFGGYLLTERVGSSARRSSNSDRGALPLSLLTDTHEALGSTVMGSTGNTLDLIQTYQNILRKPPITVFTWIPPACHCCGQETHKQSKLVLPLK